MGKKKKKGAGSGPDLRGYSAGAATKQQPSASNTRRSAPGAKKKETSTTASVKVPVSSQTHEGLINLLGQLQQSSDSLSNDTPSAAATTTRSDRFVKRLGNVVAQLLSIGFTITDIEHACVALVYSITLESALDWFCAQYPAEQLPVILTEGDAVRPSAAGEDTIDPLTIILASTSIDTGKEIQERGNVSADRRQDKSLFVSHAEPSASSRTDDDESSSSKLPQTNVMSQDEKARLLQQYQYVDESDETEDEIGTSFEAVADECDDETEDEIGTSVEALEETAEIETKGDSASDTNTANENNAVSPNPYATELATLTRQLEEAELDVRDEASNYMRSKGEIKQLEKHVGQLRKQVSKLQSKVDRMAAMEVQNSDEGNNVASELNDENEDDGGGLFGMFDEGEAVAAPASSNLPVNDDENDDDMALELPTDAIPTTWTGKTPARLLDEWCRKQSYLRPTYHKLAGNGCRIHIQLTQDDDFITLEQRGPLERYKVAQEYMATRALYELNKTLPLYRLLPPFFRDLWKSWVQAAQEEEDAEAREEINVKQATMDRLLALIEEAHQQQRSSNASETGAAVDVENMTQEQASDEPLGSWDDGDSDTKHTLTTNTIQVTRAGALLRDKFLSRQDAPAYQAMLQERLSLPIYSFRETILATIEREPVTIVCAETGAGKTTQCPQFILEEALAQGMGDRVSVVCTQPRRVAATSVAERVSEEMAEPALGQTVGYQIRMEAKRSEKTKLLFCTTGIILRRLQEDPILEGVTHVVVDEVHERQYQIDVLLIALRRLVTTVRRDLKVILMSATLDADLFCSFFYGAPLVNVPGRTFPVSSYFLEDLLDATDHLIEEASPYAIREFTRTSTASLMVTVRGGEKRKQTVTLDSEVDIGDVSADFVGYKMTTRRSMDRVNEERINYDLVEDVLRLMLIHGDINESLVAPEGADLSNGSILIFLPGIAEIRNLSERLEASRDFGIRSKFEVIPLHSSLSAKDQRRAFAKPKRGCRKIILSTNIAETSVTIPDVVGVIDSGRVREVRQNKRTSTSMLATDWCSRASAKQRAGRAGRVQPGICLKLFSSRTHKHVMKEASEPELRRVPLEEVCLAILAGEFASSCMEFLRQAPQPPTEDAVQSALCVLQEVGAVTLPDDIDEVSVKGHERLTPLGRHLAKLPVHVRLGKMLIFGALFHCMDPILTVAASLSCQSPFATFWGEANEAKAKHKSFVDPRSDFLTACNVWNAYCNAAAQGPSQARKFCQEHYLSRSALNEIRDTREHFLDLLCNIGFLDRSKMKKDRKWYDNLHLATKNSFDKNSPNFEVVHAVVCAGLYPNVAHLVGSPSSDRQLWHDQQRLYIHSSSVNTKLVSTHGNSEWITFYEKFETSRVFVSTTSPIHSFALLIFGGPILVKHLDRKVIVDGWIELGIAAQSGVMFRELRKQIDRVLESMIQNVKGSRKKSEATTSEDAETMVDGIVKLLNSSANRD